MKYCMNCGVLIDESKNRICPLCDTIILKDEEINQLSFEEVKGEPKKIKEKMKKKEKHNKMGITSFVLLFSSITAIITLIIIDISIGFNIDWSIIPIISIILFILTVSLPFMKLNKSIYWYITFDTIVLCIYFLLLNLLINKEISWSYYVTLSILLLWVYLSSIFLNKIKGFIIKLSVDLFATAIFVLFVTLGLGHHSGFSRLALPINGLVFILAVISYLFIKTYIYNWYVIVATLSINTSILCLGVDILIQSYLYQQITLKWSYIVLMVLIPFTLFLMYFNNRYKIHQYLMKKFHI